MQTGKSPIMQLVTLNDFVGTLDLFTKRSIHWNLFEPTFKFEIRKLRAQVSATFQLHFVFEGKKLLNKLKNTFCWETDSYKFLHR